MTDIRTIWNPAESTHILAETQGDEELADSAKYQPAVGSFMYVIVATRPNLTIIVGKLSQNKVKPAERHWTLVVRTM